MERHIANVMEYLPVVQILDVPVPQMVDDVPLTDRILQRTLGQIGGCEVEQHIEVPKPFPRLEAHCGAD